MEADAMKRELNFWVLGGDLRQACLARLLAEDGHRVHTYALSGSVVTPTENLTLADSLDGIGRADCVSREYGVKLRGCFLDSFYLFTFVVTINNLSGYVVDSNR